MNIFVFAIFKTSELARRNCSKPSSEDEQAKQGDLQESRSRPAHLQDIQSADEGDLQDGRGSWSEAEKHLGEKEEAKNWEGGEAVYDNRVFSTNELSQ